eukprot:13953635-Ditylum_brightwellii.AAC.1
MPYTRGQHMEVWIDQNNPTAWYNNPTSNWQWTPAVLTHYSNTPPSMTCIVASHPYQTPPILTSVWQMMKTFNMVDVRAIEAYKGAGIGL